MTSNSDVGSIIKTVAGSVFEISILSVAGYILARKKIITSRGISVFNQTNNAFFTPAFIIHKVAFSLTTNHLLKLYIVILGFLIVTVTSAFLAYLPARLFKIRASDRNFCLAVSMFMNSNSLPIALVTSILGGETDQKNGFEWDSEDTHDQQVGRSVSYLVVYSTFGLVLRWSYGVSLLSVPTSEKLHETHDAVRKNDAGNEMDTGAGLPSGSSLEKGSAPIVVSDLQVTSNPPCPASKDIEPGPRNWGAFSKKTFDRLVISPIQGFLRFMSAPLYAALLSFVVVCIPKAQKFLGGIEPLRSGLKLAGSAAVPLTLIVLGAYCHTARSNSKDDEEACDPGRSMGVEGPESRDLKAPKSPFAASERLIIFIGIFARQVAAPTILIPVLFLIRRAASLSNIADNDAGCSTMAGSVIEDPCFVLVMVLLVGAPPAITLAQMATANKFPVGSPAYVNQQRHSLRFGQLISKTLLASYAIFTPISIVILVLVAAVVVRASTCGSPP